MDEPAKEIYEGAPRKWKLYRSIKGKYPYIIDGDKMIREEDESAYSFAAVPLGPKEQDHAEVFTYMSAITQFRRLHDGAAPIAK